MSSNPFPSPRAWAAPPGVGKSAVLQRMAHLGMAVQVIRFGPPPRTEWLRRIVRWVFRRAQPTYAWASPINPSDFAGLPVPYNPHPSQRTFGFEEDDDAATR